MKSNLLGFCVSLLRSLGRKILKIDRKSVGCTFREIVD